MIIRTLPTTPLVIFCKILLHFQVIVKSAKDPDDSCKCNSYALKVLPPWPSDQAHYGQIIVFQTID